MNENIQIGKEEMTIVTGIANDILKSLDSTKSVRENMLDSYMARLAGSTLEDAQLDVEKLTKGVVTFTKTYEKFREDGEISLKDELNAALEGKTLDEKYICLLNMIAVLKSLDNGVITEMLGNANVDLAEKLEEIKNETVSVQGEVTDEKISELIAMVEDATKCSAVGAMGGENLSKLIKEMPAETDDAVKFVETELGDIDYKCYAALAAYVAYKEGKLTSIPEGVDAEIIATGVAAGIEREKVIEKASAGIISWEFAFKLIEFIGGAVLYALMAYVIFKVALLVLAGTAVLSMILFSGELIALAMGLIFGGYFAYKTTEWLADNGVELISSIGDGYDRVVAYVKEKIYPAVVKNIESFITFIKENIIDGFFRRSEVVEGEMVTVNNQ